jgi:nicotinamidase-related amidase
LGKCVAATKGARAAKSTRWTQSLRTGRYLSIILEFWPQFPNRHPFLKKLPVAAALANRHPERTVFTRFIPPERPDRMPGMWRRYYTRWRVATRECLDLRLCAALCPPATVIDKTRYSALAEPRLVEHLRQWGRADRLGI